MIATVEPKKRSKPHFDLSVVDSSPLPFDDAIIEVMRVPEETPSVMRRQPTPALAAPFRWATWRALGNAVLSFFRLPKPAARLQRD
jgi:hypothetical protein